MGPVRLMRTVASTIEVSGLLPGFHPLFVTRKRLVMFPREKCLPASAGILFATTFTWWREVRQTFFSARFSEQVRLKLS
jgi:hypothetical protein